jgi:hypothetical protein
VVKITNIAGLVEYSQKFFSARIHTSHINYIDLDTVITRKESGQQIIIGIQLTPKTGDLGTITVAAQKKIFEPISGGYSYTPDKKTVRVSTNGAGIIDHLPGILKEKDGRFKLLGTTVTFWIDGVKSDKGEQDLKLLRPEEIRSIKVYTTPPAFFDASSGTVIEIITINNLKKGLGGTINTENIVLAVYLSMSIKGIRVFTELIATSIIQNFNALNIRSLMYYYPTACIIMTVKAT